MRRISRRVFALLPIVALFAVGLSILAVQYGVNGPAWATNRANLHIYTRGAITRAGTIYDRNGLILAHTVDGQRVMPGGANLRRATLHAVGDPQGFVAAGAHTTFRTNLVGYNRAGGLFSLIATGQGNDVHLSIDAQLNQLAFELLRGRPGTVGLMNYETGQVLAMVSSPNYDPLNKPANIANNPAFDGVYLNRLLHGLYVPGSTFKVITAFGALDLPNIAQRQFNCTGRFATGEGYVTCPRPHGQVNFQQAMAESCNGMFAQLALEIGNDNLIAAAETLGFNRRIMPLVASRYPAVTRDRMALGWAGIGQHTTLANPAHMMVIMGAIANGGRGMTPQLTRGASASTALRIQPAAANSLRNILLASVDNPHMGGKTGTAQVEDGRPHAWFVGFSAQRPYAVVVVVENGGGGGAQALPIAQRMLEAVH